MLLVALAGNANRKLLAGANRVNDGTRDGVRSKGDGFRTVFANGLAREEILALLEALSAT